MLYEPSMADDIATALTGVDHLHLNAIYPKVRELRRKNGRSTPINLKASIRNTLQRNCSDCPQFQGDDRFVQLYNGVWALRR